MSEESETITEQPISAAPHDPLPKPPSNSRQWVLFFVLFTICCWGAVGAALISGGALAVPPMITAQQETQVQAVTQTRLALITPTLPPTETPRNSPTPSRTPTTTLTPTRTLIPTQTPSITPTPLATSSLGEIGQWPVLLTDSFASNANNWTTIDVNRPDDLVSINVVGSTYHWEVEAVDGFWLPVGFDLGPVRDFYASIDTTAQSEADYFHYGIIFRANGERSFYYFALTQQAEPFFGLYYNDRWTRSVTFDPLPELVNPDTNRLGVIAEGSHFTFMLNGQPVASIEDDHLPYGSLGLAIGQDGGEKVVFDFDNLEILKPELDRAHVPTATAVNALVEEYQASPLVFNDTFDSSDYDWYTGPDTSELANGTLSIRDGKYHWSYKALEGFIQTLVPDHPKRTDFYLSVEAQKTSGAEDGLYGVVVRKVDEDNFYFFAISDKREVYIYLLYENEWQTIDVHNFESAIRPGEVNTLGVLADGDYLAFFINGQYITDIDNAQLKSGYFGLGINLHAAGDTIEADFDNIKLFDPNIRPTATPWPSPTPVSAADAAQQVERYLQLPIIFEEDFESNLKAWDTYGRTFQTGYGTRLIFNGIYKWSVITRNREGWAAIPSAEDESNFYYAADVQQTKGPDDVQYGLAFRAVDEDNFYFFSITNEGQYLVQARFKGIWSRRIAPTSSSAIRPGQVNRLAVIAEGSEFLFFINDTFVASLHDERFASGRPGVGVDVASSPEAAEFIFDNLEVHGQH